MTGRPDNPFERFDLDPQDGLESITERLKELAEDARTDAERNLVREAWEELTLHPMRRLRAALFAHPESRSPVGRPPPRARVRVRDELEGDDAKPVFELRDIAERPRLARALAVLDVTGPDLPSLLDDPHLR